ncbi:MAG: RluA family pseudouridine synthase [Bacteroidota bacterium]
MPDPKQPTRYPGRIGDWVLYKTHQLIAFNKPGGMPVQPDKSGDLALTQIGAAYARTDLQAIHRLDRPVSGVVLLSKKTSAQTALTKQFKAEKIDKVYLAVVGEKPPKEADTLVHHLLEAGHKVNKTAIVESDTQGARIAELSYRLLGSSDRYYLLEIRPRTGRKHQIRVQLAAIGCPLRGDTKYGFKRGQTGGLVDLHAWKLGFAHPVSGEEVHLVAPLPDRPVWKAMGKILTEISKQ